MHSTKLRLALGLLALGACTVSDSGADSAEEKLAARARMQSARGDSASGPVSSGEAVASSPPAAGGATGTSKPTPMLDECATHKWYGDGECDAWCPRGDTQDCAKPSDIACAEFFSPADGKCDPKDPCGPVQDEDCQHGGGGSPGCDPGATEPAPHGDGKCEAKTYAELKAAPDCATLACPAILSLADGKCEPRTPCDLVIDEDCLPQQGGSTSTDPGTGAPTPVACIEIAFAANGKCEAAPGCEYTDPADCAVACIAILYPTNGKCEAAPGCEASDPDCSVICDARAYPRDGKCEAPMGCERNDPDCR